MKIKTTNMKKIKKMVKVKFFAVGLVSAVFLSGCSLNLNDKNNEFNNKDSNYIGQESDNSLNLNDKKNPDDNEEEIEDFINGSDDNIIKEDNINQDREMITINFTFINSDCIKGRDLLFTYSENKEIHATMYVYNGETNYSMKFRGNDFIIHSKTVGEINVDVNNTHEFNVTIDYLEKTMTVEEQKTIEKSK